MIQLLLRAWTLFRFVRRPLYQTAKAAVQSTSANRVLNEAALSESEVSFCPRCGQRPQDDRRKEEARLLVYATHPNAKRADVDFSLSLAYWLRKK